MAEPAEGKKVLFISLGNICRSPIAEAVLNHVLKERGITNWEVDSGAIGSLHVGQDPDPRAISIMEKYDIHMSHKARQLRREDFFHYDYILAMDNENISDIRALSPATFKAKIEVFGSYDPKKEMRIRDPYKDDEAGFEKCYQQCLRCSNGFLDSFK